MELDRFEPQDAIPQAVGCPYCRQNDAVWRMPLAAERGWVVPAPSPQVPFGLRPLWGMLCSAVAVAIGFGVIADSASGVGVAVPQAVIALTVSGGLATVNYLGIIGIRKRRKRILRGRPAALAVWSEGWFCRRCRLVYFQPGYEPEGVRPHQALSYAEFLEAVYRAGGYQDLLGKKKA